MKSKVIVYLFVIVITANAARLITALTASRFIRVENRIHVVNPHQPGMEDIGGHCPVFLFTGQPVKESGLFCQCKDFHIIASNHVPGLFVRHQHLGSIRIGAVNSPHVAGLIVRRTFFQRDIDILVPRTHARHTNRRNRSIALTPFPILIFEITLRIVFTVFPIHGQTRHQPLRISHMPIGVWFNLVF